MQGVQVFAWLLKMAGMDGLFLKLFKLGMLYPLIQLGLLGYTYYNYTGCASAAQTQWDGTSASQIVSCSTYTAKTYIPTVVDNDKYIEFLGGVGGSALLLMIYNQMSSGKFNAAFGSGPSDDAAAAPDADAATPAAAAPADGSAPASDSSSAAAPASDSSSTAAPAADKPAASGSSSTADDSAASWNSGGGNNWNAAPANDPEPAGNNNGGWNSGWNL